MPNEKTSIPCAVCRDLAPLVADGVASARERGPCVRAHLAACPACAAEWPGPLCDGERLRPCRSAGNRAAEPDDARVLRRLHRQADQPALALCCWRRGRWAARC